MAKKSIAELEAELAERAPERAVEEAEAKAEAAASSDAKAREVEAVAARIEHEEPAVSTEEATARAKEEVGDPDPFNTVKGGSDREIDVKTGLEKKDVVDETATAEEAEASPSGTAKDETAKDVAEKKSK